MTRPMMHWLMNGRIERDAKLSLARLTLEPNVLAVRHKHPNCDEVIHLLSGRVDLLRGDEWLRLEAGDTVLIPAQTVHLIKAVECEKATLIVGYSNGRRIFEPV